MENIEEKNIEENYLETVYREIEKQLIFVRNQYDKVNEELTDMLSYANESFYTMDPQEVAVTRNFIEKQEILTKDVERKIKTIERLKKSAYFGKIVFNDFENEDEIYIGISNLQKDENMFPLICDWRAPISSVYYDYEVGKAKYEAPMGEIKGELLSKRQLKIKEDKLIYFFDSSLTISDEILKEELANSSSSKMKTIVSTIQKEQNEIIRNLSSKNIIIQGVAGSGKTSIALHRAAFMLYNNRKTLKADDILILSPNTLFTNYISDILPELGENDIPNLTFYDLAKSELSGYVKFQTRQNMLEDIIENKGERLEEIKIKTSYDFYLKLKSYLENHFQFSFIPRNLTIGEVKIPKEKIEELYIGRYKEKSPSVRINWIADYIFEELKLNVERDAIFPRINKILYSMFKETDITEIYSDFLNNIGLTLKKCEDFKLRNEDAAPVLFIKEYLLGNRERNEVKYLIIDEMQDYSPLHIALLNKMFSCGKILLGDINQTIERKIDISYLEDIKKQFESYDFIKLNKSYRSTEEISLLAEKLVKQGTENVSRHGEVPKIISCKNENDIYNEIIDVAKKKSLRYNRVAIICKSDNEAKIVYEKIREQISVSYIDENINSKISVMPCVFSKGIEFDSVIIPFADKNNYCDDIDKNILYISLTRALHDVSFIHAGELTDFLK